MRKIKLISFVTTTILLVTTFVYSQEKQSSSIDESVITNKSPNQDEDVFTRLINLRGAKSTNSDIKIKLKSSKIEISKVSTSYGKPLIEEYTVLSIPVEITNSSNSSISMKLRHEWFGGIVPFSDLLLAVQNFNNVDAKLKLFWKEDSGFQVGNIDNNESTVLLPGNKICINVRLNYHGTGSEPHYPLIDETEPPQEYLIKFLFFKTDYSQEYLLSQPVKIELPKNVK